MYRCQGQVCTQSAAVPPTFEFSPFFFFPTREAKSIFLKKQKSSIQSSLCCHPSTCVGVVLRALWFSACMCVGFAKSWVGSRDGCNGSASWLLFGAGKTGLDTTGEGEGGWREVRVAVLCSQMRRRVNNMLRKTPLRRWYLAEQA